MTLRHEVWSPPGITPHVRRIADLRPSASAGSLRLDGTGYLSITIPPERLAEIVGADPADPANDVTSLVKVWRGTSLVGEFLIDSAPDELAQGPVTLSGTQIDAVLGREIIEAWDWDGTDPYQSISPDWLYGSPTPAGSFANGDIELPADGMGGNGGFEDATTDGWTSTPDDGFFATARGGPTITTVARTGSYALGFTARASGFSGVRRSIAVIPGEDYTVTLWIADAANNGDRYVAGVRLNDGGTDNGTANGFLRNGYVMAEAANAVQFTGTVTSTFQLITLAFTAGAEQETSEIVVVSPDNAPSSLTTISVDDIAIAGPGFTIPAWYPNNQRGPGGEGGTLPEVTFNRFEIDTLNVQGGTQALVWQVTDTGTANGGPRQVVTGLTPGATYTIVGWVDHDAAGAETMRVVVRNPAGAQIANQAAVFVGGTYTRIEAQFVPVTTEVWVDFRWGGTGSSPNCYLDDAAQFRGLAATSPGAIWGDLLDDAQTDHAPGREALLFLAPTFSTTLDSGGAAWADPEMSIEMRMGQRYDEARRQFADRGYEFVVSPTVGSPGSWDLGIYNPGGAGTDHTGADSPALVIGQGWVSGPVIANPPIANTVLVQGADGWTARASDAASVSSDAGRRALFVGDLRTPGDAGATSLAAQHLADQLASTVSAAISIVEPVDGAWPAPGTDYRVGDTVNLVVPGRPKLARRIRQIDWSADPDGLTWTVVTADPWTRYLGGPSPLGGTAGGMATLDRNVRVLGETVNELLRRFPQLERPNPIFDVGAASLGAGGGAGPVEATWLIAGYDQRQPLKDVADLVLSGVDDLTEINDLCAQVSIAGGGRIILGANRIYQTTDLTWSIPNNVAVHGMGEEITVIELTSGAVDVTVLVDGVLRDVGGLTGGL